MRLSRSTYPSFVCFLVVMLAPDGARADVDSSDDAGISGTQTCSGTTQAGSEVVALASPGQPQRWVVKSGTPTNVTDSRRADNLHPWGISFSDCGEDMRLDFPLTIANFGGDEAHVEVWAGATVDCSIDANRSAASAGVSHACWQVAARTGTQVAGSSPLALTVSVYARDVLRYEQPPTQSGQGQPYDPSYHASSDGELACEVQTDDSEVPINLYFLAVNSAEHVVGQSGCYVLGTDLVGPPAPPQVTVQAGDTLLSVSWTSPGSDPDLVGFDVWSDPPAGGAKSSGSSVAGCGCSIAPGVPAVDDAVEESEIAPEIGDGASTDADEGGGDSSVDGSLADSGSARDGGNDSGSDGGGDAATDAAVCRSENLTGHSSPANVGGISQIDGKYLAHNLPGTTPPTSSSPLTLTGMKNGTNYAVVVTSTDAYGNDGPASDPGCAVPQTVSDFWGTYAGDNGSVATCALETVGGSGGGALLPASLLATAAALLRRRRR
ncbi:MAG TPA: hypothetical protein VF765_08180 [Polyangiaceae bacterium]